MEETLRGSERWMAFIAAFVGPMFVAFEVLSGLSKVLVVGAFIVVLVAVAVREARGSRVRPRMGALSRRLLWTQFAFVFVLLVSLNSGEALVGTMHNGLLAVVAYVVYLTYSLVWLAIYERAAADCVTAVSKT